MLSARFAFLVITVILVGFILTALNPGGSHTASAAPNQQIFDITTEMVPSNWPLIPSGLGPGDSFRLMFVTTGTTDGTTNGVSRYNQFVYNEAGQNPEIKRNMKVLFTALVSVYQGIDARGNTRTLSSDVGANSPIYWVGGDKVADSYADFYDGSWDSRAPRSAKGQRITNTHLPVHTGSTHQGTTARATEWNNSGWDLSLGSPPAWWAWGIRKSMRGQIGTGSSAGNEIHHQYANSSDAASFYGISPLLKIRSATGPEPVISGPTDTVAGPFTATITFPDDYLVLDLKLNDIKVSGGTASELWHSAGAGSASVGPSTQYTVTITPHRATTSYGFSTVSVSMGAAAVKDSNRWESVASNTFSVKYKPLARKAVTIPFDDDGVGAVPQTWYHIPSADLKPGDSFRLLFVTSDTRDATSGQIGDYNSFVQSAAARNDLFKDFSSRFRALASTSGVHAIDNSGARGTGVPIYWVEGAKAADTYTDFFDGSWDSRAGVDENGKALPGSTLVVTGTHNDGTGVIGVVGASNKINATNLDRAAPFEAFTTSGVAQGHYYALSPVLKIAKIGGL